MIENDLWKSYRNLHEKHPRSDSEAKVGFYNQNSDFIKRSVNIQNPDVSIVIPAYNESDLIPRTLAGINSALEYFPGNATVIIVNNSSTDDTKSIAEFFGARVVDEKIKGIGRARQTGLEESGKSRFILTTDADTVVPKQWIAAHYNLLNYSKANFTYGRIKFLLDSKMNVIDELSFCIYDQSCQLVHRIKENKTKDIAVTGASNNGFNKELALLVGGYNPSLRMGEDTDLMRKIAKYGNLEKVDTVVLTSARRILGEGIVKRSISRLKANLVNNSESKDYSGVDYKDYREKN